MPILSQPLGTGNLHPERMTEKIRVWANVSRPLAVSTAQEGSCFLYINT